MQAAWIGVMGLVLTPAVPAPKPAKPPEKRAELVARGG